MLEPTDPRAQRAVNQLRLVVVVPVLAAVAGVIMLASKLSGRFRAIEEPPGRDYPPVPVREGWPAGQPLGWVESVPVTATRTNDSSNGGPAGVSTKRTPPKPAMPQTTNLAYASSGAAPVPKADPGSELLRGHAYSSVPATYGIVGTVRLHGTPPAEKEIPMDPACGALHPGRKPRTRLFVVGTNGGLADVFVVLRGLGPFRVEPPGGPVEIRQRGCEYFPYVSAAQLGQIVRVFNDDSVMHNVHPTPMVDGNREQNRAQLPKGAPLDFAFPKPEMFLRFKCDVHPWMFAYVSIVEHSFFAVTGADGQFALPEPPPGDYTLRLYHRKAGDKLVPVKVQQGQRLEVNVTMDMADMARSEATTNGQ